VSASSRRQRNPPLGEKLSASLNLDNLLDQRYYTIFDVYSTYTWGEPRSVRVSTTYRF